MVANYIRIALRNIKRQKGYSIINITGLTIGLTCFLLITLWVRNELSYDTFHEHADNLYRINMIVFQIKIWTLGPWIVGQASSLSAQARCLCHLLIPILFLII